MSEFAHFCETGVISESAVVLGYPNSERTQQNGADKRKHGTHRQNIEPQGKVHVTLLLFEVIKHSRGLPVSEADKMYCSAK